MGGAIYDLQKWRGVCYKASVMRGGAKKVGGDLEIVGLDNAGQSTLHPPPLSRSTEVYNGRKRDVNTLYFFISNKSSLCYLR